MEYKDNPTEIDIASDRSRAHPIDIRNKNPGTTANPNCTTKAKTNCNATFCSNSKGAYVKQTGEI